MISQDMGRLNGATMTGLLHFEKLIEEKGDRIRRGIVQGGALLQMG